MELPNIFRTFKYRNYRLFFIGQGLSLIGTWMQMIATGWLVYRLTGSAFLLGLVGFAGQLPSFFLAPFTGAVSDRWDKHKILIATQTVEMVQALILAALIFTGHITVWYILLFNVILGLANAFDMPTRQAFVIDLIENKADLGNAIALNSAMFNGARLIGPVIAGVLIASMGEGICFLINGLSFVTVLIALLMMKIKQKPPKQAEQHILKETWDGLAYTFSIEPIRYVLILLSIISLVGMPYMMLMPVFVKTILHKGPEVLGLLVASSGIGALLGALFLASRKNTAYLGRIVPLSGGIFGLGLALLAFSANIYSSVIFLFISGFGMMVQMAASNTFIQTVVDDDKRGRVMSFYSISFIGMGMLGNLIIGSLAGLFGVQYAIMTGGIVCIVSSLIFGLNLASMNKGIKANNIERIKIAEGVNAVNEICEPPENI